MDIGRWLHSIGVERYLELFQHNQITLEVLPELSESDLREIGLPLGPRKLVLKAITELPTLAVISNDQAKIEPRFKGGAAERRQLTVMFVDLVGSSSLSTKIDPEDMRVVLRGFQNAVAGEVARFGGHVAKLMGDGVLVYFGWPVGHEDAAERSVHAGLGVTRAVSILTSPLGDALSCRTGIATGVVIVGDLIGDGAAQEEAVIGDTPNLAARLQQLAPPGAVVIGPVTRQLIGGIFAIDDLGPQELKGFDAPVKAYRVLNEATVSGRFEANRGVGAELSPLIGRDQEFSLLLARWEQAKEGEGQVVLLAGEAGIGKSRLLQALHDTVSADHHPIVRFEGSPYHASEALMPVVQQLRRDAGIIREDSTSVQTRKIDAALVARKDDPLSFSLLAKLMGVDEQVEKPISSITPERQKALTFNLLCDRLTLMANKQPLLVIVEDAHWLDPTTKEFFDGVVELVERSPILLVVSFRPELSPPWTGLPHVTLLTLNRLGRRDTLDLMRSIAKGTELPAELIETMLRRIEGVPLFVEEFTKTILESGLPDRANVVSGSPWHDSVAIPHSLQDSLMARLDRLAAVKEVAQTAACIGREFEFSLLAASSELSEPELKNALEKLVGSGLLFRHGGAAGTSYTFKHALVRDAAYDSLLKERRRLLHSKIAQTLSASSEGSARQPSLVAYHLSQAGLVERAFEAWLEVGHAALARSAMHEAVSALTQAAQQLKQMPDGDDRKRQEITVLDRLSVALINTKGPAAPATQAVYEQAATLAKELGDQQQWMKARWRLWRVANVKGQLSSAKALADDLIVDASRMQDPVWHLHGHHAAWTTRLYLGEFSEACDHVQRALKLYDASRDAPKCISLGGHDAAECGYIIAGNASLFLGHIDQARSFNTQGVKHSLAIDIPQAVAHAHNLGCIFLQLIEDLPELHVRTSFVTDLATRTGMNIYSFDASLLNSWLNVRSDGDHQAYRAMQTSLKQRLEMGTYFNQTYFYHLLADAALRLKRYDEAKWNATEGLARASETGEIFCVPELYRLLAQSLLHLQNDSEQVEGHLRLGLNEARKQKAKFWELRVATDLAQLRAEGHGLNEARELMSVASLFQGQTEWPDLARARAQLSALS